VSHLQSPRFHTPVASIYFGLGNFFSNNDRDLTHESVQKSLKFIELAVIENIIKNFFMLKKKSFIINY
jgi:hypothetical protein